MAIRSVHQLPHSLTPSHRSHSFLFERPAVNLQRTLDLVLAKLEKERHTENFLDGEIRLLEEEILRRKSRSIAYCGTRDEDKKLRVTVATLTHELHFITTAIADLQTNNRSLQEKIEGCRLEHTKYRAAIQSLQAQLSEVSKAATQHNEFNLLVSDSSSKLRTSIEKIRSKSVVTRSMQLTKIQGLMVVRR